MGNIPERLKKGIYTMRKIERTNQEGFNDFVEELNRNRQSHNQSQVTVVEGYKFDRLIDSDNRTIAFIDVEGNIFKPASNVARAEGVRGNVYQEDPFSCFTDNFSQIQHYQRGPKPKTTSVDPEREVSLDDLPETEMPSDVVAESVTVTTN